MDNLTALDTVDAKRLSEFKSRLDNTVGVEIYLSKLPVLLQAKLKRFSDLEVVGDILKIKVLREVFADDESILDIADYFFYERSVLIRGLEISSLANEITVECEDTRYYNFWVPLKPGTLLPLSNMQTQTNGTISVLDDLPSDLTIKGLVDWMEAQTVALSLTPNDNNCTLWVNEGYADFTDRPQSEWCGDANNAKRFPEGELGRIIKSLRSAKQNTIHDFEFRAEVWNQPGIDYRWFGDARQVIIDNRSFRLLHTKHKERCAVAV